MSTGYINLPVVAGGSGIESINGDTSPAQSIVGGTDISVSTVAGTTTISFTGSITSTDSFVIMQTPLGTYPTASSPTDTLTFANTDGYVDITGDAAAKSITIDIDASLLTLINSKISNVTASSPVFSSGGTTPNITIQQANSTQSGYLSSTDWNTFNNKQTAGNYITALTGDVTASGPGSSAATLATVNSSPGTYTNATLTVNGKGLVTAASDGPTPVTSVSASAPLSSSGGTTPNISITGSSLTEATSSVLTIVGGSASQLTATTIQVSQATTSTSGYLSSTDWTTFNNKQSALTFADSLVNSGGTVKLVNDSASPTASQYYGTNGSSVLGYYNLPGSSGANTSLSNLSAVAINTSLLPGTTNSINLGSATDTWENAYIGTELFTPLIQALGSTGAALVIKGGTAATNGAGGQVTVEGANGDGTSTGGNGGNATLQGGNANGTNNNTGGAVNINGGQSVESGVGGTVTIQCGTGGTGSGTAGATGGTVNVNGGTGGAGSSTSGNGGGATIKGGSGGGGVGGGAGGQAELAGGTGGTGSSTGGNGGAALVQGGSPGSVAGAQGGNVTIAAGNGPSQGGAGGTITISTGQANGSNTTNYSGGSMTFSVGSSQGSSGGAQIQFTAGTGGIGTGTTGANGGNITYNGGAGGAGSSTGGAGGNIEFNAGVGGNSTTPGSGGIIQFFTASTTSLTEKLRITNSTTVNVLNANLYVATAGFGLEIAHGSNCKLGTATLSAGTVTVSNTSITANSVVFLTVQTLGTVSTPQAVACTAKVIGTSFTITSASNTDTSTIAWMIVEQG